jgi:hypothetical protein
METLRKYFGMIPVALTDLGNAPFNKDLMHSTVHESPRAMLMDLENIKKLFVERNNEKSKANKA